MPLGACFQRLGWCCPNIPLLTGVCGVFAPLGGRRSVETEHLGGPVAGSGEATSHVLEATRPVSHIVCSKRDKGQARDSGAAERQKWMSRRLRRWLEGHEPAEGSSQSHCRLEPNGLQRGARNDRPELLIQFSAAMIRDVPLKRTASTFRKHSGVV